MELIIRQITTNPPPIKIERECLIPFPNITFLTQNYISGKEVEMLPELMFSKAVSKIPSDPYADTVFFDDCPYMSEMSSTAKDPFRKAQKNLQKNDKKVTRIIQEGKTCILMALHPLSYPLYRTPTRSCILLVEDKTINGNDKDIIIPAGALPYPVEEKVPRQCLLTFFGNHRHTNLQFGNIRVRVLDAIRRLNAKDVCVNKNVGKDYVKMLGKSKFCFVLPGDTQGGEKLGMSIMQGCVPVITHHTWKYQPFFEFLNYSKFAVQMPKKFDLKEFVSGLRRLDLNFYQNYLSKARLWFDYTRYDKTMSPYTLVWSKIKGITE